MKSIISISKCGIGVTYRCVSEWVRYKGKKRCPDKNTDICLTCDFCKAELSARDATKLLNSYEGKMRSGRK